MTTQRIAPAEEIASQRAVEPATVRLRERGSVFAERAARLETLAPGHAMGEYLGIVARVARAQQRALDAYSGAVTLPDAGAVARAREHSMPPLAVASWRRDASWRDALAAIVGDLRADASEALRAVLDRVAAADSAWIEDQADRILHGRELSLDRGAAVFVAAGLQVYWTHLAAALGASAFKRLEVANLCPCCGSRPVASVMRMNPVTGRHRYLACTLCVTEWYYERIKCANCDSTEGIEYVAVEGARESVKAETCKQCSTYTKIFYPDKDPALEPFADDLATLDLDITIGETTDFRRAALNLALFPGDDEGDAAASRGEA
jgi:FdhE protein